MFIQIEGNEYFIPSSLLDITLQERLDFDQLYGNKLREQLQKIQEMKEGILKEMEFTEYHLSLCCKTISHFCKIQIDIIERTDVEQLLSLYHHFMQQLSADVNFSETEHVPKKEILWKSDKWIIAPPELKHNSRMTTGEFVDSKQVVQNMFELGQEKWGSLLPLCCIYLRKEGEEYSELMMQEGSERYELMKTLPLQHALEVGFFLSSSMHLFLLTFQSFKKADSAQLIVTKESTSKTGDGSTSLKKSQRRKSLISRAVEKIRLTVLKGQGSSMF